MTTHVWAHSLKARKLQLWNKSPTLTNYQWDQFKKIYTEILLHKHIYGAIHKLHQSYLEEGIREKMFLNAVK